MYRAGLVLAHQHSHQLDPDVRHAVLWNVGTLVMSRLGAEDAAAISREFAPKSGTEDLFSLPNYTIYLKLMIDGTPSRPFIAVTLNLLAMIGDLASARCAPTSDSPRSHDAGAQAARPNNAVAPRGRAQQSLP